MQLYRRSLFRRGTFRNQLGWCYHALGPLPHIAGPNREKDEMTNPNEAFKKSRQFSRRSPSCRDSEVRRKGRD